MNELLGRLKETVASGEPVTIIYHDEGPGGVVRRVSPVHVAAGKLLARDHENGGLMSLRLEHIEAVEVFEPQAAGTAPKADRPPLPVAVGNAEVAALERLGWYVVVADGAIALHHRQRDGSPSRWPDVAITGFVGGAARGYRVHGPGLAGGRVFARITDAVHAFAAEAVGRAPTPGGGST